MLKPIPVEKRFWDKVDIKGKDECWNWKASKDKLGRGFIGLIRPHTGLASRVAYEITNGKIPKGMEVCHKCDNPSCCNPNHLFLGTHKDNMRDMWAKGRAVTPNLYGENHGMSKLSSKDVVSIRKMGAKGIRVVEIAEKYHVTPANIRYILRGDTRKNG